MMSMSIIVEGRFIIFISFPLGTYELHITTKTISANKTTLCKMFCFSDKIKQHQTAIECDKTILGDTIIVKKTDVGPLRLFEIYPIGKQFKIHSKHPLPLSMINI